MVCGCRWLPVPGVQVIHTHTPCGVTLSVCQSCAMQYPYGSQGHMQCDAFGVLKGCTHVIMC
jgi:hypothetical protein